MAVFGFVDFDFESDRDKSGPVLADKDGRSSESESYGSSERNRRGKTVMRIAEVSMKML